MLINYLKQGYYANAMACFIALITYFILQKKNLDELKIFKPYLILYIITQLAYFISVGFFYRSQWYTKVVIIARSIDLVFTLFEFFIFFTYIKRVLEEKYKKSILWIIFGAFYLSVAIFAIENLLINGQLIMLQNCYTAQAIALLILCTLYFFKLFQSPPVLNLLNEPSFWVVTGLTFCLLSTLPFSFYLNTLVKKNYVLYSQAFSIIYIFYILLFLMIARASICKKAILK
jgi:hypothetical protein